MNAKKLGIAFFVLASATASAQDYKPIGLPQLGPEPSSFPFTKDGLSYSGEASALQLVSTPAKTHLECERAVYIRSTGTYMNTYLVSDCSHKRSSYDSDFSDYYHNIKVVVDRVAQTYVRKAPIAKLSPAQSKCMKEQYEAWINGPAASQAGAASIHDDLGISKVEIILEDNAKKATPDAKLQFGPDASTKGRLKLRVLLTSAGQCITADASQLTMTITGWKAALASNKALKPVNSGVDTESSDKFVPGATPLPATPITAGTGTKIPTI